MKLGFIWFKRGVHRFSKHEEPPQNSRHQSGHMKQVPHWGHTHFRCQQDLAVMEIWNLCTLGLWKNYLDQGRQTYSMRVQNGTWKNSLARGIHCCPNFFIFLFIYLFLLHDQYLCIVKNIWLRRDCIWITVVIK